MSGEKKEVEFLNLLVSCPKFNGGVPLHISVADCELCPDHKGIDTVTEIKGIKIFDVLCNLPVRRRVIHVVREVSNGSSE